MTNSIRRRGFTLIELLVVVSIIVLLTAILLPSLSKARDQARVVKCASNMKAIVNGEMTYAAEFGGFGTPYCTDGGSGYSWKFWTYVLYKSGAVPSGKVFACQEVLMDPSAGVLYGASSANVGGKIYDISRDPFRTLGINANIAGTRGTAGIPLSRVRNPSQVLYIGERPNSYPLDANFTSGHYGFTADGLSPNHQIVYTGGMYKGYLGKMYPEVKATANGAFADGHVEAIRGTFGATATTSFTIVYSASVE